MMSTVTVRKSWDDGKNCDVKTRNHSKKDTKDSQPEDLPGVNTPLVSLKTISHAQPNLPELEFEGNS